MSQESTSEHCQLTTGPGTRNKGRNSRVAVVREQEFRDEAVLKLTMSWQRKLLNERLRCPATPDASATLQTLQSTRAVTSLVMLASLAGVAQTLRAVTHKSELRLSVGGRSHHKTVVGWLNGKARQRLAGGNSWEGPRTSGLGSCHLVFASSLTHSTCHTLHFTLSSYISTSFWKKTKTR